MINSIYAIATEIVPHDRSSQVIQIAIIGLGGGWYHFIARDDLDRYYELGAKSGLNARGIEQARQVLDDLSGNAETLHFALRDCSKRDDLAFG